MGTGDLIAQVFIEGKSFRQIDTVRMAKFGFVGTIFVVNYEPLFASKLLKTIHN